MSNPIAALREFWGRGRRDPLQFVDALTPGNWWQNGRFDRNGVIAGVGQIATGMPAFITEQLLGGIGNGRPSVPRPNAIRDNRAAGVPRIPSVIPRDEQGNRVREEVDPRVGGPEDAPRGGGGGGTSTQLGAGQQFGSQMSFADHYDAMLARGTTRAEQ